VKVRRDVVFVSSLLFTVAFICLVPACLRAARVTDDVLFQSAGFASLANILVGLLVTWMGFVKGIRWTWFVMFIVVLVGAFPILVLPPFQHTIAITMAEWAKDALHEPGPPRAWTENVLIFALMVIALILPMKSFFRGDEGPAQRHR
jgi:hypothetical protein